MSGAWRTARAAAALICGCTAAAVDLSNASFGDQPVAIGAGPRALGMGGAFAAVADDATAVTWNPAGLVQCERPELAASAGFSYSDIADGPQRTSERSLALDHASALWPYFLGCQQVLGLAWQRQYDLTRDLAVRQASSFGNDFGTFTLDDRQRTWRRGAFASLGLSYAIEPLPGFACGATVNTWDERWTGSGSYRRDSEFDGSLVYVDNNPIFGGFSILDHIVRSETTRIRSGTSVVLGTWWQALPQLRLAAVARPGHRLRLDTELRTRSTQTVDFGFGPSVTSTESSSSASSVLRLPPSVTLAAAWRPDDLLTLSCDATVTRWRLYAVEDAAGRRSPVNPYLSPDGFRDLWTLRAGCEQVLLLPRTILVPRLGGLVEWLPAAAATPSVQTSDQTSASSDLWLGATAGISLVQRWAIWDVAVQVRWGDDVGASELAPPERTADAVLTTARIGVTLPF